MTDDDSKSDQFSEESSDGGGEIFGSCVLVPDSEYELRYVDYETALYFGNAKVIVHFAIIEPDEFAGLPVDRFYNVICLKGQPRRFGGYKARVRGYLVREYKTLVKEPTRLDRISFAALKDKRIIAELETVTHDHQHDPLPIDDQYSRVKRLIKVLPGEDW